MLRIQPTNVRGWCQRREIVAVMRGGVNVITKADLNAYVAKRLGPYDPGKPKRKPYR